MANNLSDNHNKIQQLSTNGPKNLRIHVSVYRYIYIYSYTHIDKIHGWIRQNSIFIKFICFHKLYIKLRDLLK